MTPDDDYEDFVENEVIQREGRPLFAAAMCTACRKIKPLKEFRRYLTPAEARYRGYSGNRRIEIESEKCGACRLPRRSKPEEFTTPELMDKAAKGYISPVTANAIAADRQRRATSAMRTGANNRWSAVRIKQWDALIDAINAELHDVRQQAKYAREKGDRPKVVTFASDYAKILVRVRADFKLERRRTSRSPEHDRWQSYVTPRERNIIAALWNDIPFKLREAGMRAPMAFSVDDRTAPKMPLAPAQTMPQQKEKGTVTSSSEGQTSSAQPDGPEPTAWEDF
jgi:hypothetical protein